MLTYKEATERLEKDKQEKAIEKEKKPLKKNKVWTLIPMSEAGEEQNKNTEREQNKKRILSNKWVFRVKDGRYKARVVVRRCEQRYNLNYKDTFSPVVNISSLRVVLALAVQKMTVIH